MIARALISAGFALIFLGWVIESFKVMWDRFKHSRKWF